MKKKGAINVKKKPKDQSKYTEQYGMHYAKIA